MTQYLYVVDTGITTTSLNGISYPGGISVGQTTYDLMVQEKFRHGIIPLESDIGYWQETNDSVGIFTSRSVGIGTTNPTQKLHVQGNLKFTGSITEDIFALSGTTPVLEPDNGTIQTWTLSGVSTPTDGFAVGQSMTLMINDGTAYTINWPTLYWVGGSPPTLSTTAYTIVELWKVSSNLYGALVGVATI